ncbi:MAG: acyltransferase [Oscillospiraceae bacterium]
MVNSKKRLPGLDLIRIVAAIFICAYHFGVECLTAGIAVPPQLISVGVMNFGEIGVWLFFLLSGSALSWQWRDKWNLKDYISRRITSIFPMFWVGFCALFLYGEVLHGNNATLPKWRLIFSVIGLDGYLLPLIDTFYKIGEWYLGCIIIIYIIFPLIRYMLQTKKRAIICCGIMGVLWLVWGYICPLPFTTQHTVLGCLPMFFIGVLWGKFYSKQTDIILFLLGVVGFIFSFLAQPFKIFPSYFCGAFLSIVIFFILLKLGNILPTAVANVLKVVQKQCYGVFLIHHVTLILVIIPLMKRFALPNFVWWTGFILLSFCLAICLYFVSLPLTKGLKWLFDKIGRKSPANII